MQVRSIFPFGVEILDVDLTTASEPELERFDALFRSHSLLVVRGQALDPEQQISVLARFGEVVDESGTGDYWNRVAHYGDDAEKSGVGDDIPEGELSFHSDETFADEPIHVQSLYPEELPTTGGATRFANGARGLAGLPSAVRGRLEGLTARHVYDPTIPMTHGRYRDDALGECAFRREHAVIQPHPYGGPDVLFLTYQHTARILDVDPQEEETLFAEAFEALYRDGNVYDHAWRPGDLVIWDNRVIQHGRADFDRSQRRVLRRVVVGDPDSVANLIGRFTEMAARLAARQPDAGRSTADSA